MARTEEVWKIEATYERIDNGFASKTFMQLSFCHAIALTYKYEHRNVSASYNPGSNLGAYKYTIRLTTNYSFGTPLFFNPSCSARTNSAHLSPIRYALICV